MSCPKFEDLKGRVMVKVENVDNERLVFTTNVGEVYELYHDQDCCESVTVEDICGELDDLVDEPILLAEEVIHEQDTNPPNVPHAGFDSFTWTFYRIATKKGFVTIRWYGESNGYYSEHVDFQQVK